MCPVLIANTMMHNKIIHYSEYDNGRNTHHETIRSRRYVKPQCVVLNLHISSIIFVILPKYVDEMGYSSGLFTTDSLSSIR